VVMMATVIIVVWTHNLLLGSFTVKMLTHSRNPLLLLR
jgi:nucleotide-binding universal stress UspA family protein